MNKLIGFSVAVAFFVMAAPSGATAAGSAQNLHYMVYAGGLKALNAELQLKSRPDYSLRLKAQTQGFIGKIFPWSAEFKTIGHVNAGKLVPQRHTAASTWRASTSTDEMLYDPQGRLTKITSRDKDRPQKSTPFNQALAADTTDMLSAALAIFQNAAKTQQCAGTFPVFDGKRKFNIALKDEGQDNLPANRYSRFSGPALKCTLTVVPVGGFKPKDQKRGWLAVQNHTQTHGKKPTLWLARVDKNGPAIPVRMEIASGYGSVVAHLIP